MPLIKAPLKHARRRTHARRPNGKLPAVGDIASVSPADVQAAVRVLARLERIDVRTGPFRNGAARLVQQVRCRMALVSVALSVNTSIASAVGRTTSSTLRR
jgi:hypothetical protein